jgi:hypothetical protein
VTAGSHTGPRGYAQAPIPGLSAALGSPTDPRGDRSGPYSVQYAPRGVGGSSHHAIHPSTGMPSATAHPSPPYGSRPPPPPSVPGAPAMSTQQQEWYDMQRAGRRNSTPQPLMISPYTQQAIHSSAGPSPTSPSTSTGRSRGETSIHAYRHTREPYYESGGRGSSRSPPRGPLPAHPQRFFRHRSDSIASTARSPPSSSSDETDE